MKILKIINDKKVPFNVLFETNEEEKDQIITFYDARYKKGFTKYGQSVSSYYVNTLLGLDGFGRGIKDTCLNLCGYIDDWYITEKNSNQLINFINKHRGIYENN